MRVPLHEAQAHLQRLLDRAADGEDVVVEGDGGSFRLHAVRVDAEPDGGLLDGLDHLVGAVEGPGDLSTNPAYLDDFGR